jgi:hypothetical protein
VRAFGIRKKKLIVAFHFQFANRAGWDCETCRANGLEIKRRCGFLPAKAPANSKPVWVRKRAVAEECPKSLVTGESLSLLEEFLVRRRLGIVDSHDLPARKVDAFVILREEMEREEKDGTSSQKY